MKRDGFKDITLKKRKNVFQKLRKDVSELD